LIYKKRKIPDRIIQYTVGKGCAVEDKWGQETDAAILKWVHVRYNRSHVGFSVALVYCLKWDVAEPSAVTAVKLQIHRKTTAQWNGDAFQMALMDGLTICWWGIMIL